MSRSRVGSGPPIVIVSATRSGSTLLQRALNTIDGVTIWGEHFGILTPLLRTVGIVRRHASALERGKSFRAEVLDVDEAGLVGNPHVNPFDGDDYIFELRGFVERLFADALAPTDRWGFKEVRYGLAELETMLDLFPGLRVIVLAREPSQQIDSMARTPWRPVPDLDDPDGRTRFFEQIQQFADRWTSQYAELKEFAERHPDVTAVVRYDQLTSQSFPMDDIAGFLDLEIDHPERLRQVFETRLGSSDASKWSPEMREELRRMIADVDEADDHRLVRAFFLD